MTKTLKDPQNQIVNPWIIVNQPGGNGKPMMTILGGMDGATHVHFGIVIADLIQHVAHRFDVDPADILRTIYNEMDEPTTTLITNKIQ